MQPFVSVARTLKEKNPVTVGVPVNAPAGESVRPAGNAPENIVYVSAPVPLLATKFTVGYEVPAVAAASAPEAGVIVKVGQAI